MDPNKPGWATFGHRYPIDGLRAIAAMVVVLFHAGMPGVDNGFVGVVFFFVLSGYLITSLLLRERLTSARISMSGFYARRGRRLLPASLLVLVVTGLLYAAVAPPLDLIENQMGFVFAALYVSNWYFLAQSQDYFAEGGALSPVLHYWSLSVEEQFYFVWPALLAVLLALAIVRRRLAPWVIGGLAAGMLALSWWLDRTDPVGAYFNSFARAYQLLAGATLAAAVLWWQRRREDGQRTDARWVQPVGVVLATVGLAAVVLASLSIVPLSPWWIGLVGVAATLALLAGIEMAPGAVVLRPLATRPMRALGRWSYSTYLWHWPVIVIAGLLGVLPVEWWLRVPAVIVVTVGLAAVTYRFVERPVNGLSVATVRAKARMITAGVLATAVTAGLLLVVLRAPAPAQDLVAVAQEGQAGLIVDDEADAAVEVVDEPLDEPVAPSVDEPVDAIDSGSSLGGATSANGAAAAVGAASDPGQTRDRSRRTILVGGDSHAFFWKQAFTEYAKKQGFRVVFVTIEGCPWMDIPALSAQTGLDHRCQQRLWNPMIRAVKEYQPDAVVLFNRGVLSRTLDTGAGTIRAGDPGWEEIVRAGTVRNLRELTPLTDRVVIVEPMPITATPMLACLTDGEDPKDCAQPATAARGTDFVEGLYRELAVSSPNVVSLDLDSVICPRGICPAMVRGVPTFSDTNHLSWDYAEMLMPQVDRALRSAGVRLR